MDTTKTWGHNQQQPRQWNIMPFYLTHRVVRQGACVVMVGKYERENAIWNKIKEPSNIFSIRNIRGLVKYAVFPSSRTTFTWTSDSTILDQISRTVPVHRLSLRDLTTHRAFDRRRIKYRIHFQRCFIINWSECLWYRTLANATSSPSRSNSIISSHDTITTLTCQIQLASKKNEERYRVTFIWKLFRTFFWRIVPSFNLMHAVKTTNE